MLAARHDDDYSSVHDKICELVMILDPQNNCKSKDFKIINEK